MTKALLAALLAAGCGSDTWSNSGGGPSASDDTSSGRDTTGHDDDTGGYPGTGVLDTPPVADAGEDMNVMVGDTVDLDGSGSYDPQGLDLDYAWELVEIPSESGVTLLNDDRVDARFIADAPGDFVLSLRVYDGTYWSDDDEVVVSAEAPDEAPIAIAGYDQYVDVGDTVTLDGSSSYDPNGQALTYAWEMTSTPSGSGAALSSTTTSSVSFTADVDGTYTVELVVNDGTQDSEPDEVQVTADDDSGSDCLGCARMGESALKRRVGLLLLPLAFGLGRRRR